MESCSALYAQMEIHLARIEWLLQGHGGIRANAERRRERLIQARRAGQNLAGGGAARAKARDAQPPVTAWAMGQRQWCNCPRGSVLPCRWCDYPGGIACMKLHAVHLAQCPEAHHTIASKINFACRSSRSLWPSRCHFPGATLRPAAPCSLRPRLNSFRPSGTCFWDF